MFRAYKKDIWYELNMDNYMSNYGIYEKLFTEIGIEPLLSIRCAKKNSKHLKYLQMNQKDTVEDLNYKL